MAVALALVVTLYGGIAKADGLSHGHHDIANCSGDKNHDGLKQDFNGFKDQDHNNGWILHKDKYRYSNGDDWKIGKGKGGDCGKGDHGPKSVPEPSSLALLSIGALGVARFLRRR